MKAADRGLWLPVDPDVQPVPGRHDAPAAGPRRSRPAGGDRAAHRPPADDDPRHRPGAERLAPPDARAPAARTGGAAFRTTSPGGRRLPVHGPMIAISNLVKRYGSFTAVDGISLNVAPGEIHGFLGPNGAGKTTTLRMIAGLLQPTSGRHRRQRPRHGRRTPRPPRARSASFPTGRSSTTSSPRASSSGSTAGCTASTATWTRACTRCSTCSSCGGGRTS